MWDPQGKQLYWASCQAQQLTLSLAAQAQHSHLHWISHRNYRFRSGLRFLCVSADIRSAIALASSNSSGCSLRYALADLVISLADMDRTGVPAARSRVVTALFASQFASRTTRLGWYASSALANWAPLWLRLEPDEAKFAAASLRHNSYLFLFTIPRV